MEIIAWEIFLLGAGNLIKSGFEHFKLFSKLKATFYKHWTSIKIKVGMTCVCKEDEVKIQWYWSKNSS